MKYFANPRKTSTQWRSTTVISKVKPDKGLNESCRQLLARGGGVSVCQKIEFNLLKIEMFRLLYHVDSIGYPCCRISVCAQS